MFFFKVCIAPDRIHASAARFHFAGKGEAFRFSGGKWNAAPSYKYEFTVWQRKFADRWESIKEIHRRHPLYDGRAGDRDQTLYFLVSFSKVSEDRVELTVNSTWGKGKGYADPDFKNLVVEFPLDTSKFAPYNTYRITQHIMEEEGKLKETVEIFKKKDGKEFPFMKMEEEAVIYKPVRNP